MQLVEAHHLTLHVLQVSFGHAAEPALGRVGEILVQEKAVGGFLCDLEVADGGVTLMEERERETGQTDFEHETRNRTASNLLLVAVNMFSLVQRLGSFTTSVSTQPYGESL